MSFFQIDKLAAVFDSELMNGNRERLADFDAYHCLRAATLSSVLRTNDMVPVAPEAYRRWTELCNGGLLFDTVLLSADVHDKELDLDFDTFDDYHSEEARADMHLPEGYAVFAVRSYGDPICFHSEEGDERVYLWNREIEVFEDIWDSFEDFLAEEIDTAIQLIGEDALLPLAIKAGDE